MPKSVTSTPHPTSVAQRDFWERYQIARAERAFQEAVDARVAADLRSPVRF